MPSSKRASAKQDNPPPAGPVASRPAIHGYGIPESNKGLLPWSHVTQRLTEAHVYWVASVSPEGQPHVTPVDGLWHEGALYFGGSPTTRRNRNLAANPAVAVHLESGHDVVILHGEAHEIRAMPPEKAQQLAAASAQKYGYGPDPASYTAGGAFEFRPRVVFAWSSFPKDVTRWTLPPEG